MKGVNASALAQLEASCTVQLIPACPACGAANPHMLSCCAHCGGDQPALPDPVEVPDAALTLSPRLVPWYARVFLRIGDALRRIARGLEQ